MTTVAHVILSSLDALGSRLPLVSDGDADAIHEARVATRRLRAALPLLCGAGASDWFEQVTPTARALGKALGRAREEDEALRLLDDIERRSPGAAAAAATVRARLLPRQLRRRRQLIKTIESLDLETLDRVRDVVRRQSGFPRRWGVAPTRSALREAVGRRAGIAERKVHHAAGVYFPNRAHRARIAIKKLRYLAELLEKTERVRKPSVRALRNAQQALGRIHDREMLLGRLSDLMEEEDIPGARELARVLEAECRSIFENYRAMRSAVLTACADLTAWSHRSLGRHSHPRLLALGAVALPSAVVLLASRARHGVTERRADPREIDLRAIPEARPVPVVR